MDMFTETAVLKKWQSKEKHKQLHKLLTKRKDNTWSDNIWVNQDINREALETGDSKKKIEEIIHHSVTARLIDMHTYEATQIGTKIKFAEYYKGRIVKNILYKIF